MSGHWLSTATTNNTPVAALEWTVVARRGATAMSEGKCVATIRYLENAKQWNASLEGWAWDVTADMPSSRFNLTQVPIKGFKSIQAAQAAIESAWAIPRHQA